MFRLLWLSSGWQIDNKTCKQLYFCMRLVYGGGGLGLDGGTRSCVCWVKKVKIYVVYYIGINYMFRLLWLSSGWQIDNKTCKQLYFCMRLVYGGGGLGLNGGTRSCVCWVKKVKIYVVYYIGINYMFRFLWPSSGWQIDNKTCKQLYFGMRLVQTPHVNYNWINQLSNTTIWWLDICCILHRYQLHVSALMAIFRLNELTHAKYNCLCFLS